MVAVLTVFSLSRSAAKGAWFFSGFSRSGRGADDAAQADEALDRDDQHDDEADLHCGRRRDNELPALELQVAEDLDRQGGDAGAGEEERRVQLAKREDEGEQRAGDNAGPDQRHGNEEEGPEGAGTQTLARLLENRIDGEHARRYRAHDERRAEDRMRDHEPRELRDAADELEEQQQRQAEHDCREDQRRQEQALQDREREPAPPRDGKRRHRAEDRRDGAGQRRQPERPQKRIAQALVLEEGVEPAQAQGRRRKDEELGRREGGHEHDQDRPEHEQVGQAGKPDEKRARHRSAPPLHLLRPQHRQDQPREGKRDRQERERQRRRQRPPERGDRIEDEADEELRARAAQHRDRDVGAQGQKEDEQETG